MKRLLLSAAVVALITAACGGGGNDHKSMNMESSTASTGAAAAGTRTVELTMVDIAYQPNTLSVKQGERIDFVFKNDGKIAHDAYVGDPASQAEHEEEMRKGEHGGTTGGHPMGMGPKGITVEPGKTGRLSYTFDKAGTIEIACHESGHYAAGMKVTVTVA